MAERYDLGLFAATRRKVHHDSDTSPGILRKCFQIPRYHREAILEGGCSDPDVFDPDRLALGLEDCEQISSADGFHLAEGKNLTRGSESHAQFDPIDVSHEQRGRFRAAVPRRRQQRSPCLAPQPRSVAARDRGSACFRMTSDRTFVSSRHFTSYGCLAVRAIHEDGVACAR